MTALPLQTPPQAPLPSHNGRLFALLVGVVIAMVGLAYASVPLYNLFCKVTGYGGTPKIASELKQMKVGTRVITLHMDANIDAGIPWKFAPQQGEMPLHVGENRLAFYVAKNLSDQPVTGMATFNVLPEAAAPYFTKVACFCFEEQTLAGGEEVEMPVSFYVDPAIENDPLVKDISDITLSYTFFPSVSKEVKKPKEKSGMEPKNSL